MASAADIRRCLEVVICWALLLTPLSSPAAVPSSLSINQKQSVNTIINMTLYMADKGKVKSVQINIERANIVLKIPMFISSITKPIGWSFAPDWVQYLV